jgi:hypothetical protein
MITVNPNGRMACKKVGVLFGWCTKMAEIVRFQPFFLSFEAVRGLALSPRRHVWFQIVHV